MCFIIAPEEIQKKERIVKPYMVGAGKFKNGTPDYIIEMHKEVLKFYIEETEGYQ